MKTKETLFENQLNDKVDGVKLKSKREQALAWWNNLEGLEQRRTFLKYHDPFDRTQNSLTNSEIEEIWKNEVQVVELRNAEHNSEYLDKPKPNQKQFKQFDESLFKAYIDKFSDEDKFKCLILILNELSEEVQFNAFLATLRKMKLDSQIESNIMTLVALKNI